MNKGGKMKIVCGYCGEELVPTERQKRVAKKGRSVYHIKCYKSAMEERNRERARLVRREERIQEQKESMRQIVIDELKKLPMEIATIIKNDALTIADEVASKKQKRIRLKTYAEPIIQVACEKNKIEYTPRAWNKKHHIKHLKFVRDIAGVNRPSNDEILSNLVKLVMMRKGLEKELEDGILSTARRLLSRAKMRDLTTISAAVYLAFKLMDHKVTQLDISELTGLSDFTIRSAYKRVFDLEGTISRRFLQEREKYLLG